ncbi:tim-barrel domain-containing protein [Linnemannia elongata]|nr:tim-barrel domain-containing protein [Linnemannia elongata]
MHTPLRNNTTRRIKSTRLFTIAFIAIAAFLPVFGSAYTIPRRSINHIHRQSVTHNEESSTQSHPHTSEHSVPWDPIQPPSAQQLLKRDPNTTATLATPLEDLVKRLLPDAYHSHFQFTLRSDLPTNSATNIHDTFRIYNNQGGNPGIVIEGVTLSALGSGLNYYLKHVCKVEMTWSGDRFDQLPVVPPLIPAEAGVDGVVRASFVPWRYYMNVVTFGYSFAFWDWTRWQRELDWMMLNGINMALAMVGQEYVIRKFYETQGLSNDDICDFLGGPAFMPWQRMGNTQGSWATLNDTAFKNEWINSQWELQGQIMQRMQAFNITPIMPSFQGFVPRKLPEKYPNVRFDKSSVWAGMPKEFTQVTFLPSTDALFTTLSQHFIQLQKAMYKEKGIDMDAKTQNFYLLDLYNEMIPTCTTPECLKATTGGVMKAFKVADPKAVWAMQSWFLLNRDLWNAPRIRAYFDGIREVNNGRDAFVVDLYADVAPLWTTTEGFYGIDWGWSMLNNFGGGQGLYGTLPTLLTEPFKGYQQPAKSMRGMGITMEGINNNEYLYQLIFDLPWQSQQALNGQTHLEDYIKRRYGPNNTTPAMLEAWTTLSQTVWDCKTGQMSQSKAIIDSTPALNMVREGFMTSIMWYDQTKVVGAWRQLFVGSGLSAKASLPLNVSSFQYDLVDVTREVLVGIVLPGLHRELVDAYKAKDLDRTRAWGQHVLNVILDTDRLLSTHTHFMVGPWIRDARESAKVIADSPTASSPATMNQYRNYLEYNARNQITWWGPNGQASLADYASKEWGGLVKEFQYPRWQIFVDRLVDAVERRSTLDYKAFLADSLKEEAGWMKETTCLGGCYDDPASSGVAVNDEVTSKYPVEAVEDAVLVAQDMVDKWGLVALRLAQASRK